MAHRKGHTSWQAILLIALTLIVLSAPIVHHVGAAQQTWEVYTGSSAPGSTTMPNIKAAIKAAQTLNSGASAPTYAEEGVPWLDSSNDKLGVHDGSNWLSVPIGKALAFADGDTTPTVVRGERFKTANTSSTTITGFDDAQAGQIITLICLDANTTIASGLTKTGMTIPLISGDVLTWVYDGTSWQQIGGSVGMGRFVPVDPTDAIGDWIASSVTSYTDVDVSDDGVRKGAVAVSLQISLYSTSGLSYVAVRPNGSSDTSNGCYLNAIRALGLFYPCFCEVGLDDNGKFEAKFTASWTAAGNNAFVRGYWI